MIGASHLHRSRSNTLNLTKSILVRDENSQVESKRKPDISWDIDINRYPGSMEEISAHRRPTLVYDGSR